MRFAASTCKPAPIYAQNNTRTPDDKSHAAIPMRSASTDSKTPFNYAHTSTPKAAWSHCYNAAKKKANRPQPQPPHRRGTFHRRLQPLYTENTRFRAPASSPKHSPCNIMQPLQCCSQHQLANPHLSTHRTTPEHQMTRVMQPFQCDLQAQIPKHPITTHTQAHPKQLEATVTMRQKKGKPTPAATAAQTRYLSSSPAATLHGKTQGFVLRLPPQNIAHATFMQPFQCDLQPQLQETHRTTHTGTTIVAKHIEGTKRPQPHPPHTRGTFHRPLQPLYTEKHKVSCSGFLPTTHGMQHSCSHSNAIWNHSFKKRIELRTQEQPLLQNT